MRRLSVNAVLLLLVLAACAGNQTNPFGATLSRPASADAVAMFVSSSWAAEPGQPRELLALNADGSRVEQLTSCTQTSQPCDFVQVAISPSRDRVAAIRSTPGAAPGATTLYFMDLSRSVESLLFPGVRVSQVDWSPSGTLLLYTSTGQAAAPEEDLFLCQQDGSQNQNVTATPTVRERGPRFAPSSQTAVFEQFDPDGVSRIYIYPSLAVTSGPAAGPSLEGTLYLVGADADPAFAPDGTAIVFRRLTGVGNGGLGTWDLMIVNSDGSNLHTLASGPVYRGAPDWGPRGILFVETDAATGQSRLVSLQADGSGRTVLHSEDAVFGMGAPRWIPGA